jgi:membrane-associated phospholipid phosphatase
MVLMEPGTCSEELLQRAVPARHLADRPDGLLATLIRRRFAVTLTLVLCALAVITEQVVTMGPLVALDYHVHNLRFDLRYPQYYDAMLYLVMVGQRGPTAIPAVLVVAALAWRMRNWRPLVLLGFALIALNGFVGAAKLLIARALPADNTAAVFVNNGIIFPSGHASNAIVTWGLVGYLLTRYGPIRRYEIGIVVTAMASLIVGIGSIYLDTHWMTDILAGWLAGIAILMVTVRLDQLFPIVRAKHRAPVTMLTIPWPRRAEIATAHDQLSPH